MFYPYRILGLYSIDRAPAFQSRNSSHYIVTNVGHSFHIYDCNKLGLVFEGPYFEQEIKSIGCLDDFTVLGFDGRIVICERAKYKKEFLLSLPDPVSGVHVVGHAVFAVQSNVIHQIEMDNGELSSLVVPVDHITCMVHLNTYLNKFLVGTKTGDIYLLNVKTGKLIHKFRYSGGLDGLVPSPALDVAAIIDGHTVVVYDFGKDIALFSIRVSETIQTLSFRTDKETMAIASTIGSIFIVDLEHGTVTQSLRAHQGGIVGLNHLPHSPMLVSVGTDNSIKEWLFEEDVCRIYSVRSGHSKPPDNIMFYDDQGQFLLSSGPDQTFRNLGVFKDSQSTELSQTKKLKRHDSNMLHPPISQFCFGSLRAKDWDNLATCHQGQNYVLTWSYENQVMGKHKIVSQDKSPVECVCLTPCGNLLVLGTEKGGIEVYNIQSGRFQYRLQCRDVVVGIFSSAGNRILVSATPRSLGFWDFDRKKEIHVLKLESGLQQIAFDSGNGFVSIANDLGTVEIYDIETRNMVRQWTRLHTRTITGLTFSQNGKTLYSSSLDRFISVLDVKVGTIVTRISLESMPTSIAVSPCGDVLAVAMHNCNGVVLFVDSTLYQNKIPANVESTVSIGQMDRSYILTNKGVGVWEKLLNIDVIKQRNKPIDPPKMPEKPAFFLYSTPEPRLSVDSNLDEKTPEVDIRTDFTCLLASGNMETFHTHVKSLSIPAIDLGIKILSPRHGVNFIGYIRHFLELKRDVDLIQTLLNVFLKFHRDTIQQDTDLKRALIDLQPLQTRMCMELEEQFQKALCFINLAQARG